MIYTFYNSSKDIISTIDAPNPYQALEFYLNKTNQSLEEFINNPLRIYESVLNGVNLGDDKEEEDGRPLEIDSIIRNYEFRLFQNNPYLKTLSYLQLEETPIIESIEENVETNISLFNYMVRYLIIQILNLSIDNTSSTFNLGIFYKPSENVLYLPRIMSGTNSFYAASLIKEINSYHFSTNIIKIE